MAPIRKRSRVAQRFKNTFSSEFPVVQIRTFCTVCTCDFVIAHGGVGDIWKHIGMVKHQSQACNESQSQKLPDLFVGAKDTSVIQAEALFTEFTVEHKSASVS